MRVFSELLHSVWRCSSSAWTTHYLSEFANGPRGWLFTTSSLLHGFGNMAIATGMASSSAGPVTRKLAGILLLAASAGILVAAAFRTDSPAAIPTISGEIHRSAANMSFLLEFSAIVVFAPAFGLRVGRIASAALTAAAALGMMSFLILRELGLAGLGERLALLPFMAWEAILSLLFFRIAPQRSTG